MELLGFRKAHCKNCLQVTSWPLAHAPEIRPLAQDRQSIRVYKMYIFIPSSLSYMFSVAITESA